MTATSSTGTVDVLTRLDVDATAPGFSGALAALDAAATRELDGAGLAPGLRELVRLRAGQLNGCACCVAGHSKGALSAGESSGPVAAVTLWRESPFVTAAERAALALTDTMTRLADTHVPEADWREASAH
jgi:AhpD family alkylhydroperoxidase